MSVTSHDVARLAGVSQPTVSRALRGDSRVADATRRRVLDAADQLGYVASELGRNLATRSTRQVAMVADLRNALYPALVEPLHDRFAEHGYRMVLLAERGDDRAAYERLLDRSVDGVVLTTTLLGSTLTLALQQRRLPFVELNRVSGRPGTDAVTAANRAGAAAVGTLLIGLGHRRIAAVLGTADASTSCEREAGLRSVLDAAGLGLPDHRVARGGFGHADGERGFAQLMSDPERPTAVFCAGDTVAVGALNEAQRRGLSVPGDVAVVGFDDLPIAGWPSFRLTTVRVDLTGMAIAAADRLVQRMAGDETDARVQEFPAELVLRSTHA